jgi:hypothetical protein
MTDKKKQMVLVLPDRPDLTAEQKLALVEDFLKNTHHGKVPPTLGRAARAWAEGKPPLTAEQSAVVGVVRAFFDWLPDPYFLGDDHSSRYHEDWGQVDTKQGRTFEELLEKFAREGWKS